MSTHETVSAARGCTWDRECVNPDRRLTGRTARPRAVDRRTESIY